MTITYEIAVPVATQLKSRVGSGNETVGAIAGPVDVTSGSGDLKIGPVQSGATLSTGSGDIMLLGASGEIAFLLDGIELGRCTLFVGLCELSVTLPVGVHTLIASYAGDARHGAAVSDPVVLTVTVVVPPPPPNDPVTITFAPPTAVALGTKVTLVATSSNGSAVTFTSSTPTYCSISGSVVTTLRIGTCSITARTADGAEIFSRAKAYMPIAQRFGRGDRTGRGPHEKSGIVEDTALPASRTVRERFDTLGAEVWPSTPEQLGQFIKDDLANMSQKELVLSDDVALEIVEGVPRHLRQRTFQKGGRNQKFGNKNKFRKNIRRG